MCQVLFEDVTALEERRKLTLSVFNTMGDIIHQRELFYKVGDLVRTNAIHPPEVILLGQWFAMWLLCDR